jgi:FkbM family methyltransferase
MLIPLRELFKRYNINFKGILHVGAHECEELKDYLSFLPINKILWVEALPGKVHICRSRYPGLLIENAIVSDVIEQVSFNISSNGQSSSMLDFGLHSKFHPHVYFIGKFKKETKLLKDIIVNYDISFNFLNFDIQGAELKALKGMEEYLPNVDYVYTEVNSDYVYKDCCLISELDEYLNKFGLQRVETKWCQDFKWGDAFYIRK